MPIFENCSILLEVRDLPFKEKWELKTAITRNGGKISFIVNKKCTHVVTSNLDYVSPYRWRSIQKFQVPVVPLEYVPSCLKEGVLLPLNEFLLTAPLSFQTGDKCQIQSPSQAIPVERVDTPVKSETSLKLSGVPTFNNDFQVAKYSIFEKVQESLPTCWYVLELQSSGGEAGRVYRVVQQWSEDHGTEALEIHKKMVDCSTSEEALEVYVRLRKDLQGRNFCPRPALPQMVQGMGSDQLHQLLLEEKVSSSTISQEEGVFVELLWTEALGCLHSVLKVPVTNISLNDVRRAEGLLLQIQKDIRSGKTPDQLEEFLKDLYILLPHKETFSPTIATISQKLDLCQLVKDILKVGEVTLLSPFATSLGKYRALHCSIEHVSCDSPEFQTVGTLLHDRPVNIKQVFSVRRPAELQVFQSELGNVRTLLHASAPSNFVGILSRGMLLPRVGVELHGIERTDFGNLGAGIYFSDSFSTTLKYSKPGVTDGTRLLLICDVALGHCKSVQKKDMSLVCAPKGHHSVHGVRSTPDTPSDFEDNEFVVYNTNQIQIKYVVQFTLEDDLLKIFSPTVNIFLEPTPPYVSYDFFANVDDESMNSGSAQKEIATGLLDSTGQVIPLRAINIKCKLMDLLSQVIIFQTYINQSAVPIEAKFVFPLDNSAAVCGFEAFINGKHIIGEVKEKELARKQYRQAIERGHGAYLLDQDAPDMFTISVGNLPPYAVVLIKITYVAELSIKAGTIFFTIPGNVAPWKQKDALNQTTQACMEKICVTELPPEGQFTLALAMEMPYQILDLKCVTHQVKMKKTECKAVLSTTPGATFGVDGFQLSFTLSTIHLPRMWVENHPDRDSQACMLVFYPDFDSSLPVGPHCEDGEVIILLDTSQSMAGTVMQDARRVARSVLKTLADTVKVNVISFGTGYEEAFIAAQPCDTGREQAKTFVMTSVPVGGSTNLWRPLRTLSLLPPSRGIRNILLISDGHIQNESLTLQLVKDNIRHSRVFTCGIGSTANCHMLQTLAQEGGGEFEFFEAKTKYTWADKVASQVKRMSSESCRSLSVKWLQFSHSAPQPVQAPSQLHSLFANCHTLIYGFVPHCTQATLHGELNDQKIETVVSTSELQKTKGTLLHKMTARAVIRDYEKGNFHSHEAEHERKKAELKSYIINLSKEYSIISQYTSFVAIEDRDPERPDCGLTDVPKLITEEDVDFLPYMGWMEDDDDDDDDDDDEQLMGCYIMDFVSEEMEVEYKERKTEPEKTAVYHKQTKIYPEFLSRRDLSPKIHGHTVGYSDQQLDAFTERLPPPCPPSMPFRGFSKSLTSHRISPSIMGSSFSRLSILPTSTNGAAFSASRRFSGSQHSDYARLKGEEFEESPTGGLKYQLESLHFGSRSGSAWKGEAHFRGFGATRLTASSSSMPSFCKIPDPLQRKLGKPFRPVNFLPASSAGVSVGSITAPAASAFASSYLVAQFTPPISPAAGSSFFQLGDSISSSMETEATQLVKGLSEMQWAEVFNLQHQDGYWECTDTLSSVLNLDLAFFANIFLRERGIKSLGPRAEVVILRLLVTLLVLQMLRIMQTAEGHLLRTLFSVVETSQSLRWGALKKAVDWAKWADKEYPCIYSRLELGWSWESVTRQLLGVDPPNPCVSLPSIIQPVQKDSLTALFPGPSA